MKNKVAHVQPPYLGAAYYPEDWPEEQMDYDISMMKKAGITVARIGEFAWHKMEPEPGAYDFAWLHKIVDALAEAGIAVVMGTPTATPPRWLIKLHPDVVTQNADGVKTNHGGRRHCCSNNPEYRKYSGAIVEQMAKEFGEDPNIIGWQIDNEIYASGDGCFCPHCQKAFHEKLQQKYGTIGHLNESWNLNLFSQWYDAFEEIPAPCHAWHNPHLRLEWRIKQNESHVDFVRMQAEILHAYVHVPVGTDTMPFNGMDYRDMTEALDVVQFNHYNVPDNLYCSALWFDYLRTLKERPFWNTETATCWSGSTDIGQSIKPEGYNRVNSWMPIALGGEANMYWIWRTHWAGHELVHGSVLDSTGRPMHIFGEVQEVADSYAKTADFIRETRVETEVAFHFTSLNWNMFSTQSVVSGLDYMDTLNQSFYKPVIDSGLRPDVIDAAQDLSAYKVLFSPLMMTLEEKGLETRIGQWVQDGGVWVVGPLSDIRNSYGARYTDEYFGILEKLTGARWIYGIPDQEGRVAVRWNDGDALRGDKWYDVFDESPENTLAVYTEGHSAFIGKAAVISRSVGKGRVIVLGTIPSYEDMKKIVAMSCDLAGVEHGGSEGSVMVSPRRGIRKGLILIEYANAPGAYMLSRGMKNLLTGETCSGRFELAPYEIAVLEELP